MQAITAIVALRLFSNLNSYGLPEVTSLDPKQRLQPKPTQVQRDASGNHCDLPPRATSDTAAVILHHHVHVTGATRIHAIQELQELGDFRNKNQISL